MKKLIIILLIIGLSYFAVKSLLSFGFFPMHDDTQVARVYEMHQSLRDGMFPVRWVKDLGYGYGYPIFNYYAPLAYYVGGFFMTTGMDALSATKLMMAVGILISGITMFLLAKSFWGTLGGILSALLYMYAPYHALDIYVRGDVAEFWAYAWLPLVVYGMWEWYKTQKVANLLFGSIGFALLILSHNLSAMMITPFLVFLFCIQFFTQKEKGIRFFFKLTLPFWLGVLFSAFYWMPALLEMSYTNVLSQIGGGADFHDHYACVSQLWYSAWGYGGSIPGCVDGLSFRIGKIHILLTIISLFIFLPLLYKKKTFIDLRRIIIWASVSLAVAVFLMLQVSQPVWEALTPMKFFQYPWRFLFIVSFCSSLLSGAIFIIFQEIKNFKQIRSVIVILFAVGIFIMVINAGSKIFVPQFTLTRVAEDYTNQEKLQWITSRISDEYMPADFIKSMSIKTLPISPFQSTSDTEIQIITDKTQEITATTNALHAENLDVNIAYFPAWNVYVDASKVALYQDKSGMRMHIPQGKHQLRIVFEQTVIEQISNAISFASIVGMIVGIIYTWKVRKV